MSVRLSCRLNFGRNRAVGVSYSGTATAAINAVGTMTAPSAATVPAAPSLAVSAGNTQATLTWTDGSNGGAAITSRKIYRGTSAGSLTLLATITSASPYTDTGLTNGATYYYAITAVNSVGEGARSTTQSATPSAVANAVFGPTGFNVGSSQLMYYGVGFPFLDRFKSSEWKFGGGIGPIVYNADLYPTAIPSGATLYCLLNVEGPLGPTGVTQRYVIETNKLDMAFNIAGPTQVISAINTSTSAGVYRYEFTVDNAQFDRGYRVQMNVTALPTPFVAGTHYIKMFRIDEETVFKAGGIFTSQFLNRFALVDVIRFMDWLPANQSYLTSPWTWAQRPQLSWGSWNMDRGVPFEIMVALCNQTSKHMYVNIPAQIGITAITETNLEYIGVRPSVVTDDINIAYTYIDNMAALISSTLNSNLLCGVEFANENWNYQFDSYYYLRAFRPRLLPAGDETNNAYAMAGYRGTRLLGRFMKAVGYNARFLPLWCTQAANGLVTDSNKIFIDQAIAEWGNSSHANYDAALASRYQETGQVYKGLGITAYFHAGFDSSNPNSADRTTVLGWANDVSSAGVTAAIRQVDIGDQLAYGNPNSLSGFNAAFANQIAKAQAYQIPWFSYEGNIEIPGAGGNLWPNDLPEAPSPNDVLSRAFYQRMFADTGMRALMLKEAKTVRLAGGFLNDILADLSDVTDTYGTLTLANGALTQRGLGLQDFKAAPGPYPALGISMGSGGAPAVNISASRRITTTGGLGRVNVAVTGLPPGRTFDGFRTISGAYTEAGTYTTTATATDDAGNTQSTTQTLTVGPAAIGKRYLRLRVIGIASFPTSQTIALGNGLPSLSEVTFKDNLGATILTDNVTTSGDQFNTGEGHQYLIDNSTATVWTGAANKTNLVVFDFSPGGGAKPATIVMQDRASFTGRAPGDFAWDWSDDGTTWIEIFRTTERLGSTPGNAIYGNAGGGYSGAYPSNIFTVTPVYP